MLAPLTFTEFISFQLKALSHPTSDTEKRENGKGNAWGQEEIDKLGEMVFWIMQ